MEHDSGVGGSSEPGKAARDIKSLLPDVSPPDGPVLPARSTSRLTGVESDGPMRSLVKYLLEWNHSVYKRW
eukprot:4633703-Pyramimonas_sp.AAC.1